MRQHMLNGWLVAALVALACLLGITAYIEVRNDLPHIACVRGSGGAKAPIARCQGCEPASCDNPLART